MRENDGYLKSRDESTLDKSLDICRSPRACEDDSQVRHSPKTWVDAVMAAAVRPPSAGGFSGLGYFGTNVHGI